MTDTSLRDGSHAQAPPVHREQVRDIVAAWTPRACRSSRSPTATASAAPRFNYGFSLHREQELIKPRRRLQASQDRLPDASRRRHQGRHQGRAGQRRVDLPDRHPLHRGRHLDPALRAGPRARPGDGRLPDDGHTQPPEALAEQARIMADAGCQCVYVVDSAGALVLEGVADRVAALVAELGDDAQVGFHGHENLGLGVANTVDRRPRRRQADRRLVPPLRRRRGQHAGRGARRRVRQDSASRPASTSSTIVDAAEDVVRPAMAGECLLDRLALIMGYAGVYSSFLKHAIPRGRALRRVRRRDPAPLRGAQADRRPGGSAHRHRRRDRERTRCQRVTLKRRGVEKGRRHGSAEW